MQKFFRAIYGEAVGLVSIVNRNENDYDAVDSEHWRHWPESASYLAKYCSLRANEDTYCSVALFSAEHRTKDDSGAICHAVWADADTCTPDKFRVFPSIAVETSPGRWHCWWVLDMPVIAAEAERVAQKIAYAHRDEGCDLGWFASKILRVPGTTNLKDPEHPFEVTADYSGEVFTLAELEGAYSDIELAVSETVLSDSVPDDLSYSEQAELENRVIKNSPYENLYTVKPEDHKWSDRLFRLQFDLFREGCTPREVFTLSKNSACNKFRRDNRPDTELWKTVKNAYAKYVTESEGTPAISVTHKIAWNIPEFMTEGERASLPETFVDRYTAWVAQRTDACPAYQRTLAYVLLSCVFADRGFLPDSSGKKFLNLWALIVAESTGSRKSTAKDIFGWLLHGYERNALDGTVIDIGSDVTKEGLGKALGDRDGKVSLVQTDEVSGMFNEFYGKNYQLGTISYFTDLYGGNVPVVLRAGKDAGQKKRAKTIFNFVGVGIRKEVSQILTRKDFESGFLARMLWCVGTTPPRIKGSNNWPRRKVEDYDIDVSKWVFDLKRRANKFNPDKPAPVDIDTPAELRFNVWAEVITSHAESYNDAALTAASDRLQQSVRKCAALLAMYDGKDVISMRHLMPALAQAELWYADLLRMLDEVSASGFERLLDEVEKFISLGKGGVTADAAVRRKFAHLRPQEMGEVLQSLKSQGRIRNNGDHQLQVLV